MLLCLQHRSPGEGTNWPGKAGKYDAAAVAWPCVAGAQAGHRHRVEEGPQRCTEALGKPRRCRHREQGAETQCRQAP